MENKHYNNLLFLAHYQNTTMTNLLISLYLQLEKPTNTNKSHRIEGMLLPPLTYLSSHKSARKAIALLSSHLSLQSTLKKCEIFC